MIINAEDLEVDEDMRLYKGEPVNGVVQAFYPGGTLKKESFYVNGFEEGPVMEWYKNGRLKSEWYAAHGAVEGVRCKWHENGVMASKAKCCKGVVVNYDEWDESGQLISHFERE